MSDFTSNKKVILTKSGKKYACCILFKKTTNQKLWFKLHVFSIENNFIFIMHNITNAQHYKCLAQSQIANSLSVSRLAFEVR